ncbi:MAG: hypothetical protein NTX76_04610 [Alphaproteobacteria bacterium]|nr:hypothetical protein [Alphaproteobacteria bacterium]
MLSSARKRTDPWIAEKNPSEKDLWEDTFSTWWKGATSPHEQPFSTHQRQEAPAQKTQKQAHHNQPKYPGESFTSADYFTVSASLNQKRKPRKSAKRTHKKTDTIACTLIESGKRLSAISQTIKEQYIQKEIFFAMNKLSITALITGLMFLGALFFTSGFLMAFNLYGMGGGVARPETLAAAQHLPSANIVAQRRLASAPAVNQNLTNQNDNRRPSKVAAPYAVIGGVNMVPNPHLPSAMIQPRPQVQQMPAQQMPVNNYTGPIAQQQAPYGAPLPVQGYGQAYYPAPAAMQQQQPMMMAYPAPSYPTQQLR